MTKDTRNDNSDLVRIRLRGEELHNLEMLEACLQRGFTISLMPAISRTRLCRLLLNKAIIAELKREHERDERMRELPMHHKETPDDAKKRKRAAKPPSITKPKAGEKRKK